MLSHSIEQITWVEKEKRAYSHALKKNVNFKFLRFNLSDDYNFEMNDNDVADQLRLVYRLMRFQQNMKWWWALWLWGIEVSLVNAFMMYRQFHELKGSPMKYDHYHFHEACGLAYVEPETMWPSRHSNSKTKVNTPPPPPSKKAKHTTEISSRSPKITTAALCPDTGSLKSRLDLTHSHLPVLVQGKQGNPICQLHW